MDNHGKHEPQPSGSFWRSRTGFTLVAFLAVAAFLLAYEHRIHLFAGNASLVLLLVGCFVMHLFMHRGGHGHGGGSGRGDEK
ncbi:MULTISPECIES: DUF2933 domain-containing protein [unclassified Paracoccus (in: a-proteobacteria)]|uniref:DUF2933 domain-containing protein n=1 Tax=Paracoccus TaxID=265 RepID=UPI000CCFDC0D|nr:MULTISPECIES: DUF2933 domain-containing protein [unclassified Paracoccus (in: a-proteobacteria)]QIR86660.1 DUF2933 domain-containing protein [Paracoccus sp. AK26]